MLLLTRDLNSAPSVMEGRLLIQETVSGFLQEKKDFIPHAFSIALVRY